MEKLQQETIEANMPEIYITIGFTVYIFKVLKKHLSLYRSSFLDRAKIKLY